MGIRNIATRALTDAAGRAVRTGQTIAGPGWAVAQRLLGATRAEKQMGDADLANKVRTELFRNLRGPAKGDIDINVVDGAVYLRGVAKTPQQINRLEAKARAIPEVREVHNLLHVPETPAPTRTDTPASQRKTRRSGSTPRRPRTEPRRLNADKTIAEGEPTPEQVAEQQAGRPAAPLGTSND